MRDLELDDIFIFGVVSLVIKNQEVRLLVQIGDQVFEDLQEALIRFNQGKGENACLVALRGQKEDGRRVKESLVLEYLHDETWHRVNQMSLIISHEGLQLKL
jgi:hypothetical protein